MKNNKNISGAEAVIKSLIKENVDLVFGYPGGAIMPVYDEFFKFQDKIHHVLTRHEQGAVHAAQGYARSSGRVGVAIATAGIIVGSVASTGLSTNLIILIETIAKAGIAAGVDGIFLETHPKPSETKSDGANMLQLDKLEDLLIKLVKIRKAIV